MSIVNRKYSKNKSQVFQVRIASVSRFVFDIFASMLPDMFVFFFNRMIQTIIFFLVHDADSPNPNPIHDPKATAATSKQP